MNSVFSKWFSLLVFIAMILGACSKEDILQNPRPENPSKDPNTNSPAEKATFSFVIDAPLNGGPYHSSNLSLVVSVVNDKNEEVIKERKLWLNIDGTVKSESIQLPVGNYKLTSFRMEYGNVYTHFVIPMAGSTKAALVEKPLAMDFTLSKTTNEVAVKVIKVLTGEKPPLFGYPVGSFDYSQEENSPYVKMKLKAIMQIGDVLYDSIPAALMLTTIKQNGEQETRYIGLKAGVNEIELLKSAARFKFRVDKWGTFDELTLDRNNIEEGTVYTFGGSKEAKKLKAETVLKLVDGAYVAESRKEFIYDALGKITQIKHLLKRKDNTPYVSMLEQFEYSGGKVTKISRFDESNTKTGSTSFVYDAQGKVSNMSHLESGQETAAAVSYLFNPVQEIGIQYTYPGKGHQMNYSKKYYGGNMIEDAAYTSYGTSESGKYNYDFNINPYIHLNLPNLYFSNTSKNNITGEYKTFSGNFPTTIPYNYTYTYDNDGYPKELIRHFKSYTNNTHVASIKTVYAY